MNESTTQRDEILRGIKTLFTAGDVVELRIPKAGKLGTIAGYFEVGPSTEALAAEIENLSGQHPSIYYTLNPCDKALLARSQNHTTPRADLTTTDNDITSRRWMLIDLDPDRPAGVSSSDEEKAQALETAKNIHTYLKSLGWPAPVSADSGNGYHLLYRVDLPNTKDSADTVKAVLKFLADKFDTDAVSVDQAVFNAARITKAYGSLAAKGENTKDRPHRLSRLRTTDGGKVPVTLEQLQHLVLADLIGPAPKTPQKEPTQTSPTTPKEPITPEKVEEFLSFYDIDHDPMKPYSNGLLWQLVNCPFNSDHHNESSVTLSTEGALGFKCFHNSCSAYHWKEYRNYLEELTGRKFYFFDNIALKINQTNDKPISEVIFRRADTITMQKINWLWEGVIPAGKITTFAGYPGVGKGLATMDIAARVSTGAPFPGLTATRPPASVLIVSSEDSAEDTLTKRLKACNADMSRIYIVDGIKSAGATTNDVQRLLELDKDLPAISKMLDDFPEIVLVILDPVSNHLGAGNINKEQEYRRTLAPYQTLAHAKNVSFITVTHFNKNSTADALARVAGSMAVVGIARMAWGFVKDPDSGERHMLPIKTNIVKDNTGYEFDTEEVMVETNDGPEGVGRIDWGCASSKTFADAIANQAAKETTMEGEIIKATKLEKATDWLKAELKSGNKVPKKDLLEKALGNDITAITLRRARLKLKVKHEETNTFPFTTVWWLPVSDTDLELMATKEDLCSI